jgi:acyl carrier protein
MSRSARENDVIAVLTDTLELGAEALDGHFRLEDLPDWDSVGALRLLVSLEEALGVRIDLTRFMAAVTVDDIINVAKDGHA